MGILIKHHFTNKIARLKFNMKGCKDKLIEKLESQRNQIFKKFIEYFCDYYNCLNDNCLSNRNKTEDYKKESFLEYL